MGCSTQRIAYCFLLELFHPSIVPFHDVNWLPSSPHDYQHNGRIIQTVLKKFPTAPPTDIDKLASGALSQHYDLLHWFWSRYSNWLPPPQPEARRESDAQPNWDTTVADDVLEEIDIVRR
eukprot:Selendium_serpulae@DN3866_c0_g1_i4.p1